MSISDEIIKLRKKSGLTQEAFSEKIGVSRQAVAKWESGDTLPEIEKLILISDLFRVTLDSLIRGEQLCSLSQDDQAEDFKSSPLDEIKAFLCKAKKLTYAANGAEMKSSRLESKEALGSVSEDFPYRGPKLFINGDYTFHCKVEGEFDWFNGEEEIFYQKEKIYECLFHGGYVK